MGRYFSLFKKILALIKSELKEPKNKIINGSHRTWQRSILYDYIPKTKKSKKLQLMEIKETKEEQLIRRVFKEIYPQHFESIAEQHIRGKKLAKPFICQLSVDIGNFVQGRCPIYYEHMKKKWRRSFH